MSIAMSALIKDALLELGVVRENETPGASLAQFMLGRFNRLLDDWNADERAVYNVNFAQYTMTAGLQAHTIGPAANSPTWVATIRPERIINANVVLTNVTPNVKVPISIRDDEWWSNLAVPDISTQFPSDLYYSPNWPVGTVYLWPVPTTAFDVQLEISIILSGVLITDTFNLPPGYQSALTLTLAEESATSLGRPMPEDLPKRAGKARARIFAVNDVTPRLMTNDAGMPAAYSNRPTWNYSSGLNNSANRR